MPKRYRQIISKEELLRATIPANHVLVKMLHKAEDTKTHAGIQVGFNPDDIYAEGTDSHAANVAEVHGEVVKLPEVLWFDEYGMPWECEMELNVGDIVWFSALESRNAIELECEGETYRSIPYADCFVAKREVWVDKWSVPQKKKTVIIPLNCYILCEPVYEDSVSALDVTSKDKIDKTRGIIRYIGEPVKRYLREQYTDIEDLREGDLVQFEPKTPLYLMERLKETALFNDDKLYFIVQRRRVSMLIQRNYGQKEN